MRPEDEYGPLDAALIGSGAAAQRAVDQARRIYYFMGANMADKWQGPGAGDPYRAQGAEIASQAANEARIYDVLRQARPYSTGLGEALPAFALGRGQGLGASLNNAGSALLLENPSIYRLLAGIR
jgi:hypothetical protein